MCKMCEEAEMDWLRVAEASNKKAREAEEAAKPKVTIARREPEVTPADARR
jgi:hypothetical protein